MKEIRIKDARLQQAASEGMDAFVEVFVNAINEAIDGQLTTETMSELNSDQITLLAYSILRDEVMDGGFVQLIHNGYGPFIFKNPFAKAIKQWGLEIEKECTDEEFMALFEQYEEFDEMDDAFVENEEDWTNMVAVYIDDHIENFAVIEL